MIGSGNYSGAYAADKVIVVIAGIVVSGMADGDFISAEYAEDRVTPKAGADGEIAISVNPSKLGTITLTLSAASASNDELSAAYNLANFVGFTAAFPITVTDLSGRTVITASKAWVQKAPAVTFGKEVGDREYIFGCADLLMSIGGNN